MKTENRGHEYDRHYVITNDWLGHWEATCDKCGEFQSGTLTRVFSLIWKHRNCQGPEGQQ